MAQTCGNVDGTNHPQRLRMRVTLLAPVLISKAGISAAMAIRLTAALGTTPEPWMNMQSGAGPPLIFQSLHRHN